MRKLLILIGFLFILSCTSMPKALVEPTEIKMKDQTLVLQEYKYLNIKNYLSKKALFDKFGIWDSTFSTTADDYVFWKGLQLFPEDPALYSVIAGGTETKTLNYSSILIFDQKGRDLLAAGSEHRVKLVEYFSDLMLLNNSKKRKYFEAFWVTFDPEHWEKIQHNFPDLGYSPTSGKLNDPTWEVIEVILVED